MLKLTKELSDIFRVLDVSFLKSYHYHGSWYEHTYKLKLVSTCGEIINGEYDTWSNCEIKTGDKIKFIDKYRFAKLP